MAFGDSTAGAECHGVYGDKLRRESYPSFLFLRFLSLLIVTLSPFGFMVSRPLMSFIRNFDALTCTAVKCLLFQRIVVLDGRNLILASSSFRISPVN